MKRDRVYATNRALAPSRKTKTKCVCNRPLIMRELDRGSIWKRCIKCGHDR